MESGNEEERGGERRKEKRNHHPKAYDFFSASAASYGSVPPHYVLFSIVNIRLLMSNIFDLK